MKIIIEPTTKTNLYEDLVDGIILPLQDFSVQSSIYFTIDEIEKIKNTTNKEIFVVLNKNLLNEDIDKVSIVLQKLDKLKVDGIFFYDLAILKLKQELDLNVNLIWNQTHMVNNYKTCDYYFDKGVKYALLGKEITLEEIKEIIKQSKITSMVEVIGMPSVAFSRRKLITNYYKDLNKETKENLEIEEKITNAKYDLLENEFGTSFFLKQITNGTGIIKELYEVNTPYIIIREMGLETIIKDLLKDTKDYIEGSCQNEEYVNKYQVLGDFTNFFFKKTIYKVKKKWIE